MGRSLQAGQNAILILPQGQRGRKQQAPFIARPARRLHSYPQILCISQESPLFLAMRWS
jgi:hypothetical protein